MIASLFSVPVLLLALGAARFGVLSIMMPILGYAGVLDLGLSRALTKLTADHIALGRSSDIAEIFWVGFGLTFGYGVVFGATLAASAPWLVHQALNIPVDLQHDALRSIYLIAVGMTIAVATNAFRGTLEGLGRFDLSNMVRVPTGVMLALAPVFVLPFTKSLAAIIAALVLVRALAGIAQFATCLLVIPEVTMGRPSRRHLSVLMRFGSGVTISNVVGQLLFYCDRFAAGRLLTMNEVAYLTTPQDISVQLLTVPNALCGVLFPLFAQDFAVQSDRGVDRMKQGGRHVFLLMFPVSVALVLFARPGLGLWLGGHFAQQSASVLCWCAIAMLFSATSLVPYAAVLGAHRSDLPPRIYLAEAVPYVCLLWLLIKRYGIQGAALSFSLRTLIEAAIFWLVAQRLVPTQARLMKYFFQLLALPTMILLIGGLLPIGIGGKTALFFLACGNWLLVLYQSGIHNHLLRRSPLR